MKQRIIKNPYESPFLGLFEGKRKIAKAKAEALKIEAAKEKELAIKEAERQKYLLEFEAAKQGYNPEVTKAEQAIRMEEKKQESEKNLYVIVGVVVVAVMSGLFFIKKR